MNYRFEPSQAARFNVYHDRLPEEINPHLSALANSVRSSAASEQSEGLESVVLYTATSWKYRPSWITVYSIGEFRGAYEGIVAMSSLLADTYLDLEILPIIIPMSFDEWRFQVQFDGLHFKRITDRGFLCYQEGLLQ